MQTMYTTRDIILGSTVTRVSVTSHNDTDNAADAKDRAVNRAVSQANALHERVSTQALSLKVMHTEMKSGKCNAI